jgi:hypothetical protein
MGEVAAEGADVNTVGLMMAGTRMPSTAVESG